MSSFFEGANHMKFSGGQSFTSANTIIHNVYNHEDSTERQSGESSSSRNDDLWLTLHGGQQRLRQVEMCDINMLREISSGTVHMSVKPRPLNPTNPFRRQLENKGGTVKVRRRSQNAEILQFGDRRFTIVSFEPEDSGDADEIRRVLQPMYEIALSHRQAWLPQLFGLGRSATPTLIYYDELVNAPDILVQYLTAGIVDGYLIYKFYMSYIALHSSEHDILKKLSIRISADLRDWRFNHRTRSFQYDISHITSCAEEASERIVVDDLPALPSPSCSDPPLDSREIIRAFPEYLDLISEFAETVCVENLTNFARHEIITFGIVIDRRKPGILWHFPSVPTPEWYYDHEHPSDIVAKPSLSVPSLFYLRVNSTKKVDIQMNIHFLLGLKHKDRKQLRNSYLVQSLPFFDDEDAYNHLFFVDQVHFSLIGTFTSDPSTSHPPKYLHVPPLFSEVTNGMPCLRWPVTDPLFYWSTDRSGKMKIAEEDWEKYGIPKLKVETWIGSHWNVFPYLAVWDYLDFKNYDPNVRGAQFANDHGYPILVKGDPHVQGGVEKHPEKGDFRTLVLRFREVVKAERIFQKIAKGKGKDRAGLSLRINTPGVLGRAS